MKPIRNKCMTCIHYNNRYSIVPCYGICDITKENVLEATRACDRYDCLTPKEREALKAVEE